MIQKGEEIHRHTALFSGQDPRTFLPPPRSCRGLHWGLSSSSSSSTLLFQPRSIASPQRRIFGD